MLVHVHILHTRCNFDASFAEEAGFDGIQLLTTLDRLARLWEGDKRIYKHLTELRTGLEVTFVRLLLWPFIASENNSNICFNDWRSNWSKRMGILSEDDWFVKRRTSSVRFMQAMQPDREHGTALLHEFDWNSLYDIKHDLIPRV